jgi:DNA primase catalytic core
VRADVVARIVRELQDPAAGVTSHNRRFSRADALWHVADAVADGFADSAEIERLTDEVLAGAGIVKLPAEAQVEGPNGQHRQLAASHMANAALYTTSDIVAVEKTILDTAKASRPGQSEARVDLDTAAMAISVIEAQQGFALTDEQTEALLRVTTQGRQLDAILGVAGSGKTTLMRAVRLVMEAGGFVVGGAATQAVAAQKLQAESGIHSRTVASYLTDARNGNERPFAGIDLLVLDEASLTEDRDRSRLYELAARSDTDVLEVGDTAQLRGVGCGSLFGEVHRHVRGLALTQNRRQRDEDERAALAAWRERRYADAWMSWGNRGKLVAEQNGSDAIAAMLSRWWQDRQGATDPHTEMRGLVMLAATNDAVGRLNEAAQALRVAEGQLRDGKDYRVAGGKRLRLHVGDHVMLRVNDRARGDATSVLEGSGVLNGYRGVVTDIGEDGTLSVEWEQDGPSGALRRRATLSPRYVARGGVDLGYAMTIHKSQGLTVGDQWDKPDGDRAGGTVLFHGIGADNAGQFVALSRHRHEVVTYVSIDELAKPGEKRRFIPDPYERALLAAERMAERAQQSEQLDGDVPVLAQLQPNKYGKPRDAEAESDERLDEVEPATDESEEQRQARERAAALRREWALAVLIEQWDDEAGKALARRLARAKRFDRLAEALQKVHEDRGRVDDVIAGMDRDRLGRPDLRDPASYAARVVHATAHRMDREDRQEARSEEWQAARDQAADLVREMWAGRPELAEQVVQADAFDAVTRQLAAAAADGLDVRDLLAQIPVETMAERRINNPAAFAAWSLKQLREELGPDIDLGPDVDLGEVEAGPLDGETARAQLDAAREFADRRVEHEDQAAPAASDATARLAEINTAAAEYYREQLEQDLTAREYLRGRLPNLEAAQDAFVLGYAPDKWRGLTDHLRVRGYTEEELLAAGVSKQNRHGALIDRFRDRVLIGLHNDAGQLAGFIGRPPRETREGEPKYLNTPATDLYDKSRIVFGLHEQREALAAGAKPVLVEGPFDVVALATADGSGEIAPIASSGTSVTEHHVEAIHRATGGQRLVVALDGDEAGQAAAERATRKALPVLPDTRVVTLPDGHDPASWVDQHGADRNAALAPFRDRAEQTAAPDFLAERAIDRYFSGRPEKHRDEVEGRIGAARAAIWAIREADLDTSIDTALRIAERFELDPTHVAQLQAEARAAAQQEVRPIAPATPAVRSVQEEPEVLQVDGKTAAVVDHGEPLAPSEAEPEWPSWQERSLGRHDIDEVQQLLRDAAQRQQRVDGQVELQRQAVDRLARDVEAGGGELVRAVDDELALLQRRAAAITEVAELEQERAAAVGEVAAAATQRRQAEEALAQANWLTRKEPIEAAIAQAQEREQQAYDRAGELHARVVEREDEAGPASSRQQALVKARAVEKDHPHARESARRRERARLRAESDKLAEMVAEKEELAEHIAQARDELELRKGMSEAQLTAERVQRDQARLRAAERRPEVGGGFERGVSGPGMVPEVPELIEPDAGDIEPEHP